MSFQRFFCLVEVHVRAVVTQEQAKVNLSRDHLSSVQLRAGGRGSLGPDSRRASVLADAEGRKSHDRELTPKNSSAPAPGPAGRKPPAPLNLANSPSLHLLTPAEQTLCSTLRILPKPYLVIKETLVREYARRGGKLRRREARDLVKIDVNKTSCKANGLLFTGTVQFLRTPLPRCP